MNMHVGKNRFFMCLFLVIVLAQLVACGTDSVQQIAPTITSANFARFPEGEAGSFTFTATGTPASTFTLTGTLPTGVTFNTATGVLSGTPAGGTSGPYSLTITASNGVAPDVTQNFDLAVITASTALLIVHDGTGGIEADVVANLTTLATAAGLTPTASVGIPVGSLSGYAQIWDVRFNNTTPLSVAEILSYTTYLAEGRTLVLIGENSGFAVRNTSITFMIDFLGGGTITLATPLNAQTVQAPFTGPDPITTVTFLAADGTENPGTGAFITKDAANVGAALYFARGTLSEASAGRLMVVFDVNFLQAGADAALQSLTGNMIRL